MANVVEINCSFPDEDALYKAYMPFLQGEGLFIRESPQYPLGTLVNLTIKLFNEVEFYKTDARVAWITPKGSQGNNPIGLGLQFIGENNSLKNKIKASIADMLKSSQITDTM